MVLSGDGCGGSVQAESSEPSSHILIKRDWNRREWKSIGGELKVHACVVTGGYNDGSSGRVGKGRNDFVTARRASSRASAKSPPLTPKQSLINITSFSTIEGPYHDRGRIQQRRWRRRSSGNTISGQEILVFAKSTSEIKVHQ